MTDALRELVRVMDRLRSPGGCPWDAEQTHESLVPYALEETYELVEAIETADRAGLREELGDVLLQVVFHARIAAEDPDDPFDVDDVATDLVAKLVRRHPHVFEAAEPDTDLHVQWDTLKNAEKARASALDGVPVALGALARTQKIADRAARAGLSVEPPTPRMTSVLGCWRSCWRPARRASMPRARCAARPPVGRTACARRRRRRSSTWTGDEGAQRCRSASRRRPARTSAS